ncbi:hypothetical protein EDB87DRAFT_1588558 [Lactarius vividus]|nr:hypothetical protein EDB87DRAFT_1588558 [Lactarius vividus]
MATVGPSQPPPGSSSAPAPQPPPGPPSSDQITWEGDKMFNIYILDYCKKRGYHKTATQLVSEADIPPESKPPINAQQGLLFEWWSVFWVLFQAKNSGAGSEDAILYTKYQTQSKFQAQRASQGPPPVGPQPPARYPIPNGVPGSVPPLPSGQMNGIGPGGQPPPYGPPNPPSQPNGMPGPTGPPGPPGHFPPGMGNRPPMGHQQRHPNGAPQYHSPTIAPSPQSQGGPQQPPAGPMGPLGPSPMNRATMPPPNGPQHPQGPGSVGSAHQTPTPTYQQLVRPHSSHDTSSQNHMNPHPSPAMSGRLPPGQERPHMDSLDAELASYPPDLMGEAKLRAGLGEKEAQSLTMDEKQRIIQHARLKQEGPLSNGAGPPPGANMHGSLQNRAQPMQQQLSMQQQRGAKRNSTSPGEEHETLPRNDQSPPDRKRPRRTPNPTEQQQQQHQQQQQQHQQQHQQSQQPQPQPQPQQQPQQQQPQPPMAPIGSLPPGAQPMPGSMRGHAPMGGGQPPLSGFGGPQMHQISMTPMASMHGMSPNMMHGPPGVMGPQMSQSQVP